MRQSSPNYARSWPHHRLANGRLVRAPRGVCSAPREAAPNPGPLGVLIKVQSQARSCLGQKRSPACLGHDGASWTGARGDASPSTISMHRCRLSSVHVKLSSTERVQDYPAAVNTINDPFESMSKDILPLGM
jgi:hypothetical protein